MEEKRQQIVLVTEPYTVASKIVGLPGGTKSVTARLKGNDRPRAGIIASLDVNLTAMDSWCNRDCAVALTRVGGVQTVIVSLYLDINLEVQPRWLDQLMEMIEAKRFPVIMGIDTNAHSTLYGPSNNARGNAFEDFVMQYGLRIENEGTVPTFQTMRGNKQIETHIDVTISRGLSTRIIDWRVCTEYNASDHNTILFGVESGKPEPEIVRPWAKADWNKFSAVLKTAEYRIPKAMSMKKLDRLVDRMYSILDEALDLACPQTKISPTVGRSKWATEKHDKGKKKVSALYSRAKSIGTTEAWTEYREADKDFKKMCRNDKNKAWRKYKECIQSEKEMASLAKAAQWEEKREINVLTKPDGTSTDPGQETIDLLTSTHFPAATSQTHVTYNNRRNLDTEIINGKYNDWIDETKIKTALEGFEKKKSPGPDGMKPLIFEYLPQEFLTTLKIVYKASIHLGYTPKAWKRTKVIFISKPGKDTYDKPKSFRPISLSNYLLKGLERLVGWRMDRALLTYPLHNKQHGFLSGKSTESAISNTVNYIEKHIMNKQHCVGVFLDISAAFDSIRPSHVRQALLKHGGDPEMVQWYFNYITHRDIEVAMHGEKKCFSTGLGFPQGGVCSAKFWLIAFDYAIQIINRYNIEGNGYADDCSALYGGRRLDHALKRLQKMLNELTEWGRKCGLKFNPEKSVAVVFTRRRKQPPFKLKIDGGEIEYKSQVKYLGVTLDSKLHWTPHLEEKLTKTKKYLGKVANMTRKNWGPKPKLMRWAYIGVVRPMLCYGAMIWGHRAPELMEKFRRINRMAINTFANFPRSTPTAALEVMLDIKPLHLFCVQEAVAARIRLDDVLEFDWHGTSHTKRHAKSHMKFLQEKMDEYGIRSCDTDACNQWKWNNRFRINRDSFDGGAKHRQPTQYNIFTDGSKLDGQAGSGLAVYKGKTEILYDWYRLPDESTVFQAEVLAIAKAAEKLLTTQGGKLRYVKFFIDSQAAIMALGNPRVTSRAVAMAVDNLNSLADVARTVSLVWIPAHKGHIGNERADVLAKRGSKETSPERSLVVNAPKASLKMKLNEHIYKDWQTEWTNLKYANHSRSFYGGPNPGKARYVYKLARLELGRFVRIITGHNNLSFFQTKLGYQTNRSCRFCGTGDETISHLLNCCPRFINVRREILKDKQPMPDMRWSVRELLEFSYSPGINEAFEGDGPGEGPDLQLDRLADDSLGTDWLYDTNNNSWTTGEDASQESGTPPSPAHHG